jgi:hypothetical protein
MSVENIEPLTRDLKMADRSALRVRASDLDRLMTALEVNFVKLAECLVSPAWRLSFPAAPDE